MSICRCQVQCCLSVTIKRIDRRPSVNELLQMTVLPSRPPKESNGSHCRGLCVSVRCRNVECCLSMSIDTVDRCPSSNELLQGSPVGQTPNVSNGGTFTASVCPSAAARCNAVCPSPSKASIFTPCPKSTLDEPPLTRHHTTRASLAPSSSLYARWPLRREAPSDPER